MYKKVTGYEAPRPTEEVRADILHKKEEFLEALHHLGDKKEEYYTLKETRRARQERKE